MPRGIRKPTASERILNETGGHSYSRKAESDVEPDGRLQQTGQERTEERTEVDAEVVERETRVAAGVAGRIEGSDDGCRRCFEPAAPQRDQHEPTPTPANPGIRARAMWPHITTAALMKRVRSLLNMRSATHAPSTVAR